MREFFVRLRDADGVNAWHPQLERAVVWRVRTDECSERIDIGFRTLLLLRHAGLLLTPHQTYCDNRGHENDQRTCDERGSNRPSVRDRTEHGIRDPQRKIE